MFTSLADLLEDSSNFLNSRDQGIQHNHFRHTAAAARNLLIHLIQLYCFSLLDLQTELNANTCQRNYEIIRHLCREELSAKTYDEFKNRFSTEHREQSIIRLTC